MQYLWTRYGIACFTQDVQERNQSTIAGERTQYTPGPWHIGMKPGPMIYGPQGEQVVNMHVAMLEQPEHIANARLIAAAPEMLDAIVNVLIASEDDGGMNDIDWSTLRAVVAKATGA